MALDARALPAAAAAAEEESASAPAVDANVAGPAKRPSSVHGGASSTAAAAVSTMDVPLLWSDERRMKRELVAWAKAVASMAIREAMQCKAVPCTVARARCTEQ